jgi:hypothetical protein
VENSPGRTEIETLRRYPRAVVHMRRQVAMKRFGLCLGAGVSKDFGFPMWGPLISRIAAHPNVDGAALIGPTAAPSQSSRTQVLYQRFRSRRLAGVPESAITSEQQRTTEQAWLQLVHDCLYQGITTDDSKLVHPYLKEFLPIVDLFHRQ